MIPIRDKILCIEPMLQTNFCPSALFYRSAARRETPLQFKRQPGREMDNKKKTTE
jgi:hypothetical protein